LDIILSHKSTAHHVPPKCPPGGWNNGGYNTGGVTNYINRGEGRANCPPRYNRGGGGRNGSSTNYTNNGQGRNRRR
jgi:hypothetical protein